MKEHLRGSIRSSSIRKGILKVAQVKDEMDDDEDDGCDGVCDGVW